MQRVDFDDRIDPDLSEGLLEDDLNEHTQRMRERVEFEGTRRDVTRADVTQRLAREVRGRADTFPGE